MDVDDRAPVLWLHDGAPASKEAAFALHEAAQEQGLTSNVGSVKVWSKIGFLKTPVSFILVDPACKLEEPPLDDMWAALCLDLPPNVFAGISFFCHGSPHLASKLTSLGAKPLEAFAAAEALPASQLPGFFEPRLQQLPRDDGARPNVPRSLFTARPQPPKAAKTAAPAPAAPAAAACTTSEKYRKDGSRCLTVRFALESAKDRLGVQFEQLEDSAVCVVSSLKKGSISDKAGVKKGMQAISVDGTPVTGHVTLQRLIDAMRKNKGGTLDLRYADDDDDSDENEAPPASAPAQPAAQPDAAPVVDTTVHFTFASQTGNAESICAEMSREISALGHKTSLSSLNDAVDVYKGGMAGLLVVVASTTGDGEVPDNAKKLVRNLKKKNFIPL
ncbi:NADPH--cytochrome P450 reductase 1 [Diplonema papillatum]|nr:NADPH--cytochrome P450 reductase 1 [Diplonema papillatum]